MKWWTYKCDQCERVFDDQELAKKGATAFKLKDLLEEDREYHFCGVECLIQYCEKRWNVKKPYIKQVFG